MIPIFLQEAFLCESWIKSMKDKMESIIQENEKNKQLMEDYKSKAENLTEITSKHDKEKATWLLIEKEMKKNIIEIGKDLLNKSSELQAIQGQNLLKNNQIKDQETQIEVLKKAVKESNEVVSQNKKDIGDKQTDINCLNGLVIKLNEDIDKLKTEHSKNKLDTNENKLLQMSYNSLKQDHNEMMNKFDDLKKEKEDLNQKLHVMTAERDDLRTTIKEYDQHLECLKEEKEKMMSAHKIEKDHLEEEFRAEVLRAQESEANNKVLEHKLTSLDGDKDDIISKLKTDLRRRGILLKDAQNLVSKLQQENCKKGMINQMKDQIEDLESSNLSLTRVKKTLENDIEEMRIALDDMTKSKGRVEEKCQMIMKENASITNQLEDTEEELQEMLKKYKTSVTTISSDQVLIQEQSFSIIELDHENGRLKEKNSDLLYRIEQLENDTVELTQHKNAKMKINELEKKLDLEHTNKFRLEHQADRLKDNVKKLEKEAELEKFKFQTDQEKYKKLLNQFRDLKEDYLSLQGKESDVSEKNSNLTKKIEISEAENIILKKDLELAMRRIEDFHTAISSEIDSDSDTITFSEDDLFLSQQSLFAGSIAYELNEVNLNEK